MSADRDTLVALLREARKIIRASSSRSITKDWDERVTKALAPKPVFNTCPECNFKVVNGRCTNRDCNYSGPGWTLEQRTQAWAQHGVEERGGRCSV